MAQALFGKRVGDIAVVNGKEWEIVEMEVEGLGAVRASSIDQ
jgi:transcription elongation GreA/GreB family factor